MKELKSIDELDQAMAESNERPVLLFKHSTTCPISARAFREFQSYLEEADQSVSYNLIIIQDARAVSDEASERLGIEHESPQAVIVRNGREVWNASHFDITRTSLAQAIENVKG